MILAFVYLLNKVIKQYLQSDIDKKTTLNLHDMIRTMAAMGRLLFRGHKLKKISQAYVLWQPPLISEFLLKLLSEHVGKFRL